MIVFIIVFMMVNDDVHDSRAHAMVVFMHQSRHARAHAMVVFMHQFFLLPSPMVSCVAPCIQQPGMFCPSSQNAAQAIAILLAFPP